MKNGTYKITLAHRLEDLNALVNSLLPRRPLKIVDVAVSMGISTLEWVEALDNAGIEHSMTAGDVFVNGYLGLSK